MDRRSPESTLKTTERVDVFAKAFQDRLKALTVESGSHQIDTTVVNQAQSKEGHEGHKNQVIEWPSSPWFEFQVLLQRQMINNVRDKAIIGSFMVMSIFSSILISLLFWQLPYDAAGKLFVSIYSSLLGYIRILD